MRPSWSADLYLKCVVEAAAVGALKLGEDDDPGVAGAGGFPGGRHKGHGLADLLDRNSLGHSLKKRRKKKN